ncbi:MAG: tRNA 5-methoxyuridine(34)/uridine 5-oxyacetic acid(34) synthase CmoB [Pseudomonadota bacterium]
MVDLDALGLELAGEALAPMFHAMEDRLSSVLDAERNGNLPRFLAALSSCPALKANHVDLRRETILIGDADEVSEPERRALEQTLRGLMPWRKGPFDLFGIHVDTEWRSDWKWARVAPHLAPLEGRAVLDVGCGSGYHLLRMRGEGARLAIGVDPSLLFAAQFSLLRKLSGVGRAHVLPFTLEGLARRLPLFDTVFSMGVIYHRRDPMEHLAQLAECLRPGGQLVLEGLVIEGGAGDCLFPAEHESGRYAMMRNVWAVPSAVTLREWVEAAGFRDVRVVDECVTTSEEQRRTPWMTFQSLADFLDPADASRTVEGLPAPRRAVVVALR